MAQVRTRKDVWKLADWDPILLWYAKAIAKLQTRPINDPTSWRYQAAIHEYTRAKDPLAKPSEQLPSVAERKRFWNQCQHGSWFFLPWHRMYLGCFERIIMAAVVSLGGPDDWALPYWNYSDDSNANARKLPPAFIATHLPDGSVNSLQIAKRAFVANNGDVLADDDDVDVNCLTQPVFSLPLAGGAPSFGGPRIRIHSGGTIGNLESVPHGSIHNAVGGGGWMSQFNTAALDPIFWLHHCNIDRLWEVWLRRDPQHINPAESAWLTGESFDLHNATGAIVSMKSSQVIDTTAAPLLYKYQDVSDPLGAPPPTPEPVGLVGAFEEVLMPEMVGATEQPLTLQGEPVTTAFQVNEPVGPAGLVESGAPKRIYLNIENITAERYSDGYSVYLNVPPGHSPTDHRELYAGLLPMFGLAEASDPERDHPTSGLQYTLDITEVAQTLQARNDWDPTQMRVTFVPKRRAGAGEALVEEAPPTPVTVGRVSLYYS
jgi:tyrosinase